MTSKIAADKPGRFALLNGDEAVARGAVESNVKVAASYPGTPATEILETIAEVSKEFDIYAEWSINEIVAAEVAAGASMTGVRSIVSMKHVGLNVAADAAMTLAYTGVEGGMLIAVCDDPAMHSSQNEQDTRYFAVHSKLPLLDAGNPQEALDMSREAFELSEKLHLPVILRLTTRVAHGKSKVKLGNIQKINRKSEFDKKGSKWVMVPSNATRQHRVLEGRLAEAKKLANSSKFNFVEDNGCEIGIVGSGVGYYYARSILDAKKFSWLKLGFVYPFPDETVKKFASKVKKLIVIEELRPYIEENIQRLNLQVLGKKELGLQEIGEFTPDNVRQAFANMGLAEKAEAPETLDLPLRPPALCPACPHRAFYYALNMVNQYVNCDNEKCVGCDICEYICSFEKEKVFNPLKSRIRSVRIGQTFNTAVTCKGCVDVPCTVACPEKALMRSSETGAIMVEHRLGAPSYAQRCPGRLLPLGRAGFQRHRLPGEKGHPAGGRVPHLHGTVPGDMGGRMDLRRAGDQGNRGDAPRGRTDGGVLCRRVAPLHVVQRATRRQFQPIRAVVRLPACQGARDHRPPGRPRGG